MRLRHLDVGDDDADVVQPSEDRHGRDSTQICDDSRRERVDPSAIRLRVLLGARRNFAPLLPQLIGCDL